jgi:hypothetical protein
MKCQDVNELLLAYLNDEVNNAEGMLIQAHLSECDRCQKEQASLEGMQQHVSDLLALRAAQASLSPQAWSRLQTRLAKEPHLASQTMLLLRQDGKRIENRRKRFFAGGVTMKKSFAWAIFVTVILVIGTLTSVPAARALAQEILNTLTGQVTQTTVIAIEDGKVVYREVSTRERTHTLTLTEVQDEVDFTVQLPTYIPHGYSEVRFEVTSDIDQVVITFVRPGSGLARDPGTRSFGLYQMRGNVGWFLGGEPVDELLMKGQSAFLTRAEAATYDAAGRSTPLAYYVLYWQEDDISFALHSYYLPPPEMIKVAESLVPLPAGE